MEGHVGVGFGLKRIAGAVVRLDRARVLARGQ
jgi:hypothetical protein